MDRLGISLTETLLEWDGRRLVVRVTLLPLNMYKWSFQG